MYVKFAQNEITKKETFSNIFNVKCCKNEWWRKLYFKVKQNIKKGVWFCHLLKNDTEDMF